MNTGMKITAFAVTLAATFGAAYGVGNGVDPVSTEADAAAHGQHGDGADGGKAKGGGKEGGHGPPGGLQVSEDGYTLALETERLEAGKKEELRFEVLDEAGKPVTEYKREHGKDLHLIVASRGLTEYRHLHPSLAEGGTWSTDVELPEAGDYRVFTDFIPGDEAEGLTLGADLAVGGDYDPPTLPEESKTATVGDYEVTLDGDLTTGQGTDMRFTVEKNGKPVTDLDPYLGAYGHLVALRAGDMGYLHVHPNGTPGDGETKPGPGISFMATAPTAGDYRLFLDFKHEGEVRNVSFTVPVAASDDGSGKEQAPSGGEEEKSGGHQH
ncbi:hypothetical protein [Streptomyces oceani]|uniref:Heavy metal-binding domain-containing protein n=1 Tax=Streptomyces oceani TaxID=1075402 RepID=A0A1E7KNT5_9ACTN|nr:hypothetical protein [Streptomyces oceani]OEV05570.1 hypothetical protein AN216_02610 [Streptomyces oceani]